MDTFLDYYKNNISPTLEKIDLFFKTEEDKGNTISLDILSELLDISITEVEEILDRYEIKNVNKSSFFIVMKEGSSEICKYFKRQLETGLLNQYTPKNIAYIYQIPQQIIEKAMVESNLQSITPKNLNTLFSYIYIEC
ncbi:hypothetical protein EDC18_105138 [Natranaerovirga pectinivora]|uniref:Uncharacterized protein n=1 Tax=Natranaerovirga pectinivora TaxID=682400 RepID=A0A4R3MLT6_9FIRM|nr:hypothetical protein [Natranaerovirga pectinivora]TCT14657.1 hypothetical protein EDC18_105138 [Natranaerovirga pectinivora]